MTTGSVARGATDVAVPRWVRDERTLWRESRGGVVILGPLDSAPRSLRGPGALLWAAFTEPRSTPEVAAELAARFDADPTVIQSDIGPVIDQLVESGALRRQP